MPASARDIRQARLEYDRARHDIEDIALRIEHGGGQEWGNLLAAHRAELECALRYRQLIHAVADDGVEDPQGRS